MSRVTRTEVENNIKIHSDESWLAPSQATLVCELVPFIGGLERVINIYGHQGTGKTFIAHILMKLNRTSYVTSVDNIYTSSIPLIIDNSSFERTEVRGVRNLMRRFDLHQVILISRYRAEDSIPSFGLTLTEDDIRFFRANLFRNFDLHLPETTSLNLWDHLKLIGESNA